MRVTEAERAILAARAGEIGLSAYVRRELFGDGPRSRAPRAPRKSTREVAQLLALLGASEVSSSLRDLAYAAKIGVLPVHPETEKAITDACKAIDEMRSALIGSLGLGGGAE